MTDTRTFPPVIQYAPHVWFVASKSSPGDLHTVHYEPGVSVSCSCLKGRFLSKRSNAAFEVDACSHQRAVIDWLRDQIAEAAR